MRNLTQNLFQGKGFQEKGHTEGRGWATALLLSLLYKGSRAPLLGPQYLVDLGGTENGERPSQGRRAPKHTVAPSDYLLLDPPASLSHSYTVAICP